ncbi:MAG: VanZ family protein [Micrococcales bacterium]|nr:VanZ family protein [Micrococcales bacterium]
MMRKVMRKVARNVARNVARKVLAYVCYGIFLAGLGGYAGLRLSARAVLTTAGEVLTQTAICAFLIAGTALLAGCLTAASAARLVRVTVWILFVFYSLYLGYLLLASAAFSRTATSLGYADYFHSAVNLVPFRMIAVYFRSSPRYFVINFLGNIAAYAPLGLLLPALFRRLRRFRRFVVAAVLLPAAMEASQFALRVGRCDVDDVILNTTGMLIMFFVFRAALRMGIFRKVAERLGHR